MSHINETRLSTPSRRAHLPTVFVTYLLFKAGAVVKEFLSFFHSKFIWLVIYFNQFIHSYALLSSRSTIGITPSPLDDDNNDDNRFWFSNDDRYWSGNFWKKFVSLWFKKQSLNIMFFTVPTLGHIDNT